MSVSSDGRRNCRDERKTLIWTDEWWMELCVRVDSSSHWPDSPYEIQSVTHAATLPTSLTCRYTQQSSQCSQLWCLSLCFWGCVSLRFSMGVDVMSVRWGRWGLVWRSQQKDLRQAHSQTHTAETTSLERYTARDAVHLFMSTYIKLLMN